MPINGFYYLSCVCLYFPMILFNSVFSRCLRPIVDYEILLLFKHQLLYKISWYNVGAVQESLKIETIFSQLTRTTPFCLSSHNFHNEYRTSFMFDRLSPRRLQLRSAIRKMLVSNNLLYEHS